MLLYRLNQLLSCYVARFSLEKLAIPVSKESCKHLSPICFMLNYPAQISFWDFWLKKLKSSEAKWKQPQFCTGNFQGNPQKTDLSVTET